MRYERTESFRRDYRRLDPQHRAVFRDAVLGPGGFAEAAERFAATRDPSVWPARLRVKPMINAPGIWEMTWSFSGPDGRATFEWVRIEGEPGVRWRRIGGHDIFGSP